MKSINDFEALAQLPEPVLDLVIHEAELRIQSQFSSAANSDQRALVWTGFLITVGLAISGLIYTEITRDGFSIVEVALCAILIGISYAVFIALDCFRPTKFDIPGNLPENWLPARWQAGKDRTLVQARVEQAFCLNKMILENRQWAETTAKRLHLSIDVALFTLAFGVVCTFAAAAFE